MLIAAIGIAVAEVEHFGRLSRILRNSSAQIRVRGALLFLIGFAVLPSFWDSRSSSGRLSQARS